MTVIGRAGDKQLSEQTTAFLSRPLESGSVAPGYRQSPKRVKFPGADAGLGGKMI